MLKEIRGIKITGFERELNKRIWETLSVEQVKFLEDLNKEKLLCLTREALTKNGFTGRKIVEDKVLIVEGEILAETDVGLFRIY